MYLLLFKYLVAWEGHQSAITQLYFEEESRLLISGGKDKSIKFWKLPERWTNEDIEKFEENEIKNYSDSLAMIKLQRVITRKEEDDSDDDLNGWDIR
jgi:WD40 repeat protein